MRLEYFRTCRCCGGQYYRNETRRVGLAWYCRYCLDAGLVPGVKVRQARMCLVCCGIGGCHECSGDEDGGRKGGAGRKDHQG